MKKNYPIRAVCFIIFNRPKTTERVFELIRQVKPHQLLVVADGPRGDRPGEAEKCIQARAIINRIDWECEVLTNYSEKNLGCRERISSGLDWVFTIVEEAIILEDDCLPHPSFFTFCWELLERYRDNEQIMAISGDNFQFGHRRKDDSYYFSRYAHSWGWATWRRAWQHYDNKMALWPKVREENWLEEVLEDNHASRCWSHIFQNVYDRQIDTWDYPWQFCCWIQGGLTILPNVNLVSNIGFTAEATHTQGSNPLGNLPTEAMVFPLKHPELIIRDNQADDFTEKTMFSGQIQVKENSSQFTIIHEAIACLNDGNNAEALDRFENAIALHPDIPHLNYGKAIALVRLGRPKAAVDELNQLLQLVPGHQKAQLLLEEIWPDHVGNLMKKANQALKGDRHEEAFHLLNQAKALKQPTIGQDYLRSLYFLRVNQLASALECLYEELRYFQQNTEARELLDKLVEQYPQLVSGEVEDAEFQELFQVVRPYTMLSEARLYSLFSLAKYICLQNIPGNFVECGVAGGGSTALLASVIKRYTKQPRWLYAFDSFDGMPAPTDADQFNGIPADATGWGTGTCAAPEASVVEICHKLGVLNIVQTVKGYFQNTLPTVRNAIGMISLLHMDGDWYESTKSILDNLYDRVVNEGIIQVDDYGHWPGCRQAIDEFENEREIKFNLHPIDGTGVWFNCTEKFAINPIFHPELVQEFIEDDPVNHGLMSQMSCNERFQLYYALRNLLPQVSSLSRFVEIGSFAGSSLFLTWRAFKRRANPFQGFAVEPGGQPQLYEVLKNLELDVTHLPMFSHQAAPELQAIFEQDSNLPIAIFIDGDHSYEGVRKDVLNYYPLLAPGGILVFHDYLPPLTDENRDAIFFHHGLEKEPGIRQACQELMENTYRCEVIDIPLLYPTDPTQTQAHLPIIPGVFSTLRVYRKPNLNTNNL
ncbi:TylF/MycF/NovP-related O-methyltransferase [Laspinema olomoucense]|uniref:TylF/MycF/NovP-related O-methyltransferase n=1 Tax=Laspinema olomoucense TaxID=3231600 RepID=UPI0021BA6362|nr:TylF/MycF/NovP-related O-methyltransferase [Laspinema sp. D3a]MCT7989219.1 class I SAM-dependent methyltransferase [Laspinema sp. D3a]